jgi:hypothetical protein
MRGGAGDFTPPSRFFPAVAFSKTAVPAEIAKDGVLQAFHSLNQFDIPTPEPREEQGQFPPDLMVELPAGRAEGLQPRSVIDPHDHSLLDSGFDVSGPENSDLVRGGTREFVVPPLRKGGMGGSRCVQDKVTINHRRPLVELSRIREITRFAATSAATLPYERFAGRPHVT